MPLDTPIDPQISHTVNAQFLDSAISKKKGRNLKVAVPIGIFLGLLILGSLLHPFTWYLVLSLASLVALHEIISHLPRIGLRIPEFFIQIFGQCIIWSTFFWREKYLLHIITSASLFLMIWILLAQGFSRAPQNYMPSLGVSFFLLMWIPFFISCAAMLIFTGKHGTFRVISFILIAVCSDIGGYFFGVFFGKHPLVPAISPKKTWEGLLGSLLFGTLVSTIALHFLGFSYVGAIFTGPVLVIIATCGDLIESQFKREMNIKDMSNLLPEHGGLLDRLDSLLPCAGAAWVFWQFVG